MSGTNLPATEVPTIVTGNQPAAPAAETVVAAPALETPTIITPSAAPVEVPAAEVTPPTPVVTPEAAPVTPEAPAVTPVEGEKPAFTDKPTLLEATETPKPAEKAEEKPPTAVEEPKKPEESADSLKYEPFTLPEGVKVDEDRINKFTELVGPLKADQETAQKLVNLHTETLEAFRQHMQAEQIRVFEDTKAGWLQKTMSDPELGGAGHQTALQAAARTRDLLVPEEDRADFVDMLRASGVGDHPALFRMLYRAARLFDEPAAPPQYQPVRSRTEGAAPLRHEMRCCTITRRPGERQGVKSRSVAVSTTILVCPGERLPVLSPRRQPHRPD